MDDPHDLRRFVTAQDQVLTAVLAELRAGAKRTHWMWFVFPQLAGLGRSPTARFYGLSGPAEAAAYLAHSLLGPRLRECTEAVNGVAGRSVHAIFGSPDDLKFHSCMTLFARVAEDPSLDPRPNPRPDPRLDPRPDPGPFRDALARWFGGREDSGTLALLGKS